MIVIIVTFQPPLTYSSLFHRQFHPPLTNDEDDEIQFSVFYSCKVYLWLKDQIISLLAYISHRYIYKQPYDYRNLSDSTYKGYFHKVTNTYQNCNLIKPCDLKPFTRKINQKCPQRIFIPLSERDIIMLYIDHIIK